MELTRKDIVFPEVPHDGEITTRFHDRAGNVLFPERPNTTYAEIWDIHREEWTTTARDYESNPLNFCLAWHYLDGHPAFWYFEGAHNTANPMPLEKRLHVRHLTTEFGIKRCVFFFVNGNNEVWIELGEHRWPVEFNEKDDSTYYTGVLNHRLDCGGPTMETAIIRAARLVHLVYGNDRRVCDAPYDEAHYAAIPETDEEFDKFMEELGDPGDVEQRAQAAAQRLAEKIHKAMEEMEQEE